MAAAKDRASALAAVLAAKLSAEEYAELRFFLSDYTLDTWLCQALAAVTERHALHAATASCPAQVLAAGIASEPCEKGPPGWYCTRHVGHDGPCASKKVRPS